MLPSTRPCRLRVAAEQAIEEAALLPLQRGQAVPSLSTPLAAQREQGPANWE